MCSYKEQAADSMAFTKSSILPYNTLPSLSHLTYKDYNNIYEPREDSYLLLDVLKHQYGNPASPGFARHTPSRVVEVGCRSGIISVGLGMLLSAQLPSVEITMTDINSHAISASKQTVANNQTTLSSSTQFTFELADITAATPPPTPSTDIIIFNPPYVPTPTEEVFLPSRFPLSTTAAAAADTCCVGDVISAAWAGGVDGMEVTNVALPILKRSLTPATGSLFLVVVDDNRPRLICDWWVRGGPPPEMTELVETKVENAIDMPPGGGFEVVGRRQAKNEFLSIIRLYSL